MTPLTKSIVIKLIMRNYALLKIILAPRACVLIILSTQFGIEYYPLSFGLVIGFINWNNHKYGLLIGIILSLLASYISFFIAYFSVYLLFEIFKLFLGQDNGGVVALMVSSFILSPLLVFFLYKFVFNYSLTKIAKYIIFTSILILIIVFNFSDWQYFKFLKNTRLDHYTIWQIVMALAIQLLIHQKVIWKKQKLE